MIDDDVLGRLEGRVRRLAHDYTPAGNPLADIVIGARPVRYMVDAVGQEGPEALPGDAGEAHGDGVVRQAGVVVTARDLWPESIRRPSD